ncbi:MAG: LicD family protein [Oceanospirillaceae bacterium]|nr:LicD family protein [Oceanospirillaceae bacterium]
MDFATTKEYSKEDIRKVQMELLSMGEAVCNILCKYDIPHFISFGTLLGAVRHQGFVPWDDDFDLFLFDDTYDQAMLHLEEELPSHLLVHGHKNDPIYFPAWNRVVNTKTKVEDGGLYNPDNNMLKYQCIGVDMYRLKKMGKHQIRRYKLEEALKFFQRKHDFGIISDQTYSDESQKLQMALKSAIVEEESSTDKSEVFMFMITLKDPINPEDLLPLKMYKFEGEEFYGPKDHSPLLESTYGDYMKIPEYKNRKPHYLKVIFYE